MLQCLSLTALRCDLVSQDTPTSDIGCDSSTYTLPAESLTLFRTILKDQLHTNRERQSDMLGWPKLDHPGCPWLADIWVPV